MNFVSQSLLSSDRTLIFLKRKMSLARRLSDGREREREKVRKRSSVKNRFIFLQTIDNVAFLPLSLSSVPAGDESIEFHGEKRVQTAFNLYKPASIRFFLLLVRRSE